jgi:hypothetical protein
MKFDRCSYTGTTTTRNEIYVTSSTNESGHLAQGLPIGHYLSRDRLAKKLIPEEYREFNDMFRERQGIKALPEHRL